VVTDDEPRAMPPCVLCQRRERQYGRTVCEFCWVETVDRAWIAASTLVDVSRFFGWPQQTTGFFHDLVVQLEQQRTP